MRWLMVYHSCQALAFVFAGPALYFGRRGRQPTDLCNELETRDRHGIVLPEGEELVGQAVQLV